MADPNKGGFTQLPTDPNILTGRLEGHGNVETMIYLRGDGGDAEVNANSNSQGLGRSLAIASGTPHCAGCLVYILGGGKATPISFPASAAAEYTNYQLFRQADGRLVRLATQADVMAAVRRANQMFDTMDLAGVDYTGINNPTYRRVQ
jgi:hypothetical protein